MKNIRAYERKYSPPDRESLERIRTLAMRNLDELGNLVIVLDIARCNDQSDTETNLLFQASQLCDFYLLVEETLLAIARVFDRYIPASLDWRYRLIKIIMDPVPGKRSPVISCKTADMLHNYQVLFINFNRPSSRKSFEKINKMSEDAAFLCQQLENDIRLFTEFKT